ncbi:PREDICTED: gametogenetin-binding protein 1-like [Ceratotherium simum simum]|uniref:Gametogenetin-binding protein 1-like n=1 Tax=Ceratotherium simum simum TaxID=73337 RepID=A0ABM0HCQ8_CERSS|nr:PREDICTED: gametogenetin-binding protein 1-like [Ceratotherium simum simum]
MEAPATTPRSRILGHSSMLRFFRSLRGSKSSPKSSDKALSRRRACPSQEHDAIPLMTDHHRGVGRKEPRPPAIVPCILSVAMPRHGPSGLGDTGTQTPTPREVLRVMAQGVEVKSVLPRGSQEVLDDLSEKEGSKEEEEEAAGEASRDTGTSDRSHFARALEVEQGCLQRAVGPLEVSPEAFPREEKERLLDGDLRLASSKVGATPWNRLLTLYKQLQKSAKFPLKEGFPSEEKGEEEEIEEEDRSFKLCVPGTVSLQSPLHKTFMSTDTVGFVESELKKLLVVQRESRLWKMGSHEGRELLTQPEITLEEAGVVDGQHLLLEEMDEMGNWPPE